jgi:type I restriction enzyme, S subunit
MPQDLYKLPNGWEWKELSSVCQKITDGSHNPPKGKESGLPMLSSRNVFNGELVWDNYRLISEEEFERENKRTMITDGDVLLTIVGTIGRSAVVRNIPQDFTLQRSVAVLSSDQVAPEYLSLFFRSPSVQDYLASEAKGAAQKGVYLKQLKIIQIPLPPISEQERIVEKLDALFRRIDDASNRLNQILKHSQALFASALDDAIRSREITLTKTLVELAQFIDYRGRTPKKTESGIPLVTAKNVRMGIINDEPREYIADDAYDSWMTRGFPKAGDLLFTTEAPLGNVAVINRIDKFALAQRVVCLQALRDDEYISSYMLYYMMSHEFKTMVDKGKTGSTVKGIKSSVLKKFRIPLPPMEEQRRIVEHLDGLSERIQTLEKTTRNRLEHLAALKASLLDAAFRGKL